MRFWHRGLPTIGSDVNDNLRTVFDGIDDASDELRNRTAKVEQTLWALYEEAEDPSDDRNELIGLLNDSANYLNSLKSTVDLLRLLVFDAAKEVLR